jgi:di/tricarboxylate transporter
MVKGPSKVATKTLKQMFFWPIIIGLFSLIGLVLALVKDGLLEDLSLVAIAIPIAVIVYFYFIRRPVQTPFVKDLKS